VLHTSCEPVEQIGPITAAAASAWEDADTEIVAACLESLSGSTKRRLLRKASAIAEVITPTAQESLGGVVEKLDMDDGSDII